MGQNQSLFPLSGGPFRAENGCWLPADVVVSMARWRSWASRTLGAALVGPSVLLRARGLASPVPSQLPRATAWWCAERSTIMLHDSEDSEQIIERVAALDIGKAELVACIRVPNPDRPGRRAQEITTYSTMTRSLLGLADRLRELGVDRVVMEATSDYWKPVFYLLEAQGLDPWLVNAKDVKHLPGRPKTDKLDAVWLAKVAERQMIRPSFVPPPPIRLLRDLTRYRADLVNTRTAEKNRVEKLLEDAQIKLSVVVSDVFGVSGREMLAALVDGQRDPKTLAQLARTRMRAKIPLLEQAFVGRFTRHHAFLLRTMLTRIDQASADIAAVETQIGQL